MEKTLLLVDDSREQKEVLDNLAEYVRRNEGINVLNLYIDPNDRPFLDDSSDPDLDKLINGIKDKTSTLRPALIIVDQYYSGNDKYQGLDVIERLRTVPKFRNCQLFLISGNRDRIIREIFENDGTPHEKVKKLAKLLMLGIDRFLDKNFRDEAIDILKRKSIQEILPARLREFEKDKDVKLNLFTPKYKALPMAELADMIDGNHIEAPHILNEMIELTLAHYQRIDENL